MSDTATAINWKARAGALRSQASQAKDLQALSIRISPGHMQMVEQVALKHNWTITDAVRHILDFYDRLCIDKEEVPYDNDDA